MTGQPKEQSLQIMSLIFFQFHAVLDKQMAKIISWRRHLWGCHLIWKILETKPSHLSVCICEGRGEISLVLPE